MHKAHTSMCIYICIYGYFYNFSSFSYWGIQGFWTSNLTKTPARIWLFLLLRKKKPEKQVIFTSPYSRPFAWRRQRKLEISEEQDVSELHSLLPTRPPHQLLNGSCSVGKEAFQSDAVSELRQWWELTFITQEGPSTSWRCFPKSKNQIWILLFPQKVESMVVSFCWQRFSILTTCVCAAPNLVMDTEDVALN